MKKLYQPKGNELNKFSRKKVFEAKKEETGGKWVKVGDKTWKYLKQ